MKSLKTKIATVFSLLCLALSLSVFGVFSAITIQNKTTGQFGYIDKTCYLQSSDGTIKEFYSTVQKAYASATDGDTICVFTTSAFKEDLNITKNISVKAVQNAVTLDLGTYNISVGEGGSLTLGDSTYTSTSPVLTIESSDTTQDALINNTSSLVVNNGVVLNSSRTTTLQNQGNLIINGGTINKALTGQVYSAVKNIGSGNVSITGGNISVESGNYLEEKIGVAVLNEGSGNITVSGSNNVEISGDVGIATSSNILDSLLSMTDANAPSGKIIVNNAQANLSCSLAGIFSSSSSSDGVTLNAGTIKGIDNGIQSGIMTIGNCGIVIDAKGKVDISDALYGLASSGGNVDITGNSPVSIEGSTGIAILETTANVYLNNPNLNITAYSDGENSFSGIGVLYYTPSGTLNIQDCGTISGETYSISVSGESNVSVTVSSGTFNGSVFLISADFTATGDAKFVKPRVVDGSYASAIGSLLGDITIIGNNVTFDSDSAISLGGKGSVLTLENANITGVKEGVTLNTATLEVLGTTTINATEKAISVVSGSGEKVILNGALNIIGGIEVDALDYSTTSAPIIEIGTNFSTQDAITLLLNDTHISGRMIAVYKDATMANNFSKHFTHQYGLFLRGTTLCIGTLVSAPTAGQSPYVYTGNVITHLTGIDSSKMTVYGTNSATDAGSYSVTVGLNGDQYCWADTYNRESKKYSWQITPKTIQKPQLVNNSFVYNGSNQAIAFNPAVDSTSTTVTGTQSATNVGNYSVTLTLKNTKNYVWSDNSTSTYSLSWKITPKTLNKPTMSGGPFTYDGTAKTITMSGFDDATMTRSSYSATNAGSYTARIALKDKANYTWSDGTTTDVTYNWTINKLEVTIPTANPASYTYNDGKAINLTLTNPDSSYITLGEDLSGTDVGSYTATATLKDTNNYTWSDGSNTTKNISWNITKKQLSIPTLDSANFTYNGSAHTISFTGYNSSTMTLGGTQTATNAGNYQATISLKDTSNYSWVGGATTAQTYNWSISKAKLTKPTTGTNSFVYTGSLITYTPNNYSSSTMNISGNTATNVGSYTASVSIKDTTNYTWSDDTTQAVSLGWNITAKPIDKPTMSGGPFTYDGNAKTINMSGFDSGTMNRTGYTATNAGSYQAVIALKDKSNYTWSDGTTTDITYSWSINKKQLTIPTANPASYTYNDGEAINLTLTNPDSSYITLGGDLSGTDVGSYTATATLKDTNNYTWSDGSNTTKNISWSIVAKKLSKPTMTGGPFTYDGNTKTITMSGFDDKAMTRSGYSATNAGSYTARIALKDKANYTWSDGTTSDITYNWTINKRQLTIPTLGQTSYAYTGATITPTITNPDSAYITIGGSTSGVNANTYTITATINDTNNNQWKDGTTRVVSITWTITKLNLSTPNGLSWTVSSDKSTVTANWNAVSGRTSYTLTVLVNGSSKLTKSNITDTKYTFDTTEFNNLSIGTFTFTVQAIGDANHNSSAVSGASGNLYRLVFMTNYGTSAVHARQYYVANTTYSAPANPSRTGYTMAGWATSSTGNVVTMPTTVSSSVTYYAKWNAINYSITINSNGGSGGSVNANTYNISSSQQSRTLTNPSRAGYTFSSWSVSWSDSTHSGTLPTVSGTTLTIPANCYGNITVTANWGANSYSISINANGGSGGSVNNGAYNTSTSQQTRTLTNPSRAGYTFSSWSVSWSDSTHSGTLPTVSGTTLTIPANCYGNITISANWNANSYSISINANGGSGGSVNTNTYSTSTGQQTRTITNPSRAGYTFSSWSVSWSDSTHSGTLPTISGTTLTIPANCYGNITVTANWNANSYSISINANGGSGGSVNNGAYNTSTSQQTRTLTNPSRAGYTFSSWSVSWSDSTHSGTLPTISGTTLTIPANCYGNITVTANWGANSYSISINANGGSGGSVNNGAYNTSTSQQTRTLTNPSRAGYTFSSWSVSWSDSTHSGTLPTVSGTTLTIPANCYGNITISANWNANSYSISINANGGSGGSVNTNTYSTSTGQQTRTITNPSRAGYTFSSWSVSWSDSTHSGTLPTISGVTLTIPANCYGNIRLTANWNANTYNISVSSNGGSGGSVNTNTYSTSTGSQTRTLTNPSRAGYTFSYWSVSWSDSTHSGTLPTVSGTTLTIPANCYGNITVTANWNANTYSISVNSNGGSGGSVNTNTYSTSTGQQTRAITNPSRVGYTLSGWSVAWSDSTHSGTLPTISGTTLTIPANCYGNITISANWSANTNTAYKVEHYKENIDVASPSESTSSHWTLAQTDNLTGTTGASVTPSRKTYTGFTSPSAKTATINADGSTVVRYYYTRNTYTITLSRGTGISSVSGGGTYDYGKSITVTASVNSGYSFSRWTSSNASLLANSSNASYTFSVPAGNVTLTASANIVTYTITFNTNSGTWTSGYSAPSSYNINSSTITLPTVSNIYRTNYIFGGWYTSSTFSGSAVTSIPQGSTGNKTFYAKWTSAAVYNTTLHLGYSDLTSAINGASGNGSDVLDVRINLPSTTTYNVNKNLTILTNVTSGVTIAGGFNLSGTSGLDGNGTLGGGSGMLTIQGPISLNNSQFVGTGKSGETHWTMKNNMSYSSNSNTNNISVPQYTYLTVAGATLSADYRVITVSGGSVTISSGTVQAKGSGPALYVIAGSSATMSGSAKVTGYIGVQVLGNFTMGGGSITSTLQGISNESSGVTTIQAGTITGPTAISNKGTNTNSLTITGGTITGTNYGIDNNMTGTVTISGGTISATASDSGVGIINNQGGTVNISGSGTLTISGNTGISNVSSGTITVNNSNATISGIRYGIDITNGIVNVYNGKVQGTGTSGIGIDLGTLMNTTARLNVTGGLIVGVFRGINTYGILNISGGTVRATGENGNAVGDNGFGRGEITISNGVFEATGANGSGFDSTGTSGITITGGTFSGTLAGIATSATTTITDATITGTLYGVYNRGSKVTIGGGTIKGTGPDGIGIYNYGAAVEISGSSALLVTGYYGIHNGNLNGQSTNSTITITNSRASITGSVAIYNSSSNSSAITITAGTIGENSISTVVGLGSGAGTVDITGGEFNGDTAGIVIDYGTAVIGGSASLYGITGLYIGYNATQSGNTNVTVNGSASINGDNAIIIGSGTLGSLTISGSPVIGNTTDNNNGISCEASSFQIKISGSPTIRGTSAGIDIHSGGTLSLSGTPLISKIYTKSYSQTVTSISVIGTFNPRALITLSISPATLGNFVVFYSSSSYASSWASQFHWTNSTYELSLYNGYYLWITRAVNRVYNVDQGTYYTDLNTAIQGADTGDTLEILEDVTTTGTWTIENDLTIISNDDTNVLDGNFFVSSGTLVLDGSSTILTITGGIRVEGELYVTGEVNIENDSASDSSSTAIQIDYGTATIEGGGSISSTNGYAIEILNGSVTLDGRRGDLNISGFDYDIWSCGGVDGQIFISGDIGNGFSIWLDWIDESSPIDTSLPEVAIYLETRLSGNANSFVYVYYDNWEGTTGAVFYSAYSITYSTDYIYVGDRTADSGSPWSPFTDTSPGNNYHVFEACFDENTWIYYYDEKKKKIRRKRAKNVKYKDKLLVWNFDKGCFDFANPLFIQRTEIANKYTQIKFSDGSYINIVGDHTVYNADDRYFTPIVSNEHYGTPIGTKVMKWDGSVVTIVSKKTIYKKIPYTNIITNYHMNCFTNGILTSTPFNNMYRIDENMKFIVNSDKYCRMVSLLDGIDKKFIEGLRLMEFPDKVLINSPKNAGCKSFKEYIDKKLGVQKESD